MKINMLSENAVRGNVDSYLPKHDAVIRVGVKSDEPPACLKDQRRKEDNE